VRDKCLARGRLKKTPRVSCAAQNILMTVTSSDVRKRQCCVGGWGVNVGYSMESQVIINSSSLWIFLEGPSLWDT